MPKSCSLCAFLIDVSEIIPDSALPDGFSLRCGKEERFVDGWPPPVLDPLNEYCDKFFEFDPHRARWEWDENKNNQNIEKHGISFQDAVSALDSDEKSIRTLSRNWESLDSLDYEKAGIQRTAANTDPVRDQYIFSHEGKIWVLISTLRGELGLVKERVISVRRARSTEQALYER